MTEPLTDYDMHFLVEVLDGVEESTAVKRRGEE
jgi:hypothetical protein